MFTLELPPINGQSQEFKAERSIVFIGANGSGKTRLGSWLDITSQHKNKTHRISAQKSLAMPESISPVSLEKAKGSLLYGYQDATLLNGSNYKSGHRYNGNPSTSLLNDFQQLLVLLFSVEAEQNAKYKADSKNSAEKVDVPKTHLDKIKQLWEKILPHRELVIGGMDIKTKVKGLGDDESYKSSEMSDGERVIFYLIGQCLSAPTDGIIIIDEPEIHLHKSIQIPLWSEIEKLRSDCLFVYLTHDVDFAASKTDATKIWIKEYDGKLNWKFEKIENDKELPEGLLLEILGSRKDIVFVEGTEDSYDTQLYRVILKDFLVKPVGGCSQVIQNVKAFKSNSALHHLKIYGIIDRDRRVDAEIESLERDGIYTLTIAEVENFFCTEEVIKFAATKMELNASDIFEESKNSIFKQLNSELENQVSLHVMSEVKYKISQVLDSWQGKLEIKAKLNQHFSDINIDDIYDTTEQKFIDIITNKKFDDLLKHYNRKNLHHKIASAVSINGKELPNLTIRYLSKNDDNTLANELKKYFGNFPFLSNGE
jgi:ABC-type lipoprotein export system ATPase subunit